MSQRTAIVTDSTADIPAQEAERLQIDVIPALLTIDGRSYDDGSGMTRTDFYRGLPGFRTPPTTAAPSPQRFTAAYERLLSSGNDRVLSVHLSSKLSAMINIALQAAEAFGNRVHVFDSAQVSLGTGFQAMGAAAAARAGTSFEAILDGLRRARERSWTVAMINTLEYLRRSGRVHWLRAGLGEFMNIKLLVRVADGTVQRIKEVRSRHKAIEEMISYVSAGAPFERLALLHSGVPDEAASLAVRMRPLSQEEPLVVDVTTVIGAHVGPNSVGVAGLAA